MSTSTALNLFCKVSGSHKNSFSLPSPVNEKKETLFDIAFRQPAFDNPSLKKERVVIEKEVKETLEMIIFRASYELPPNVMQPHSER